MLKVEDTEFHEDGVAQENSVGQAAVGDKEFVGEELGEGGEGGSQQEGQHRKLEAEDEQGAGDEKENQVPGETSVGVVVVKLVQDQDYQLNQKAN